MLRTSLVRRFIPLGESSRISPMKYPGSRKGGSAAAERIRGDLNSSPLFPRTGSPVHLYATKENAWKDYTDDRFYGAKRMKEYWTNMLKDRGMRYYVGGVLVIVLLAGAKLWRLQEMQQQTEGLIGPRKKKYRSRLTVVLDVDETIVSYGDKAFRMKAGIVTRPYLADLLDTLVTIDAEVILWSACSERYMRQVLSVIDPTGIRISAYITRDRLWFSGDNYYEKNIAWLKRPPEDTLIIENRALAVRNCNTNAILVDDFIRGEYMDTGYDHPVNDEAMRLVKDIVIDLEESGLPVQEYLQNTNRRSKAIREIPCHLAIRQLPDEIARGVFFFVGKKYRPAKQGQCESSGGKGAENATKKWWFW